MKKCKKILALFLWIVYNRHCCGMIAMKREVAEGQKWQSGFPWSECQVRKLTTSHCTKGTKVSQVCKMQKRRVVNKPE